MLISETLNAAINAQIGNEFGNSNQYVAIAAYFEGECLFGLAQIFYRQAEEERAARAEIRQVRTRRGRQGRHPDGARAAERVQVGGGRRPSRV